MLVFKLAALVELILVILENSGIIHLHGLPLGGGQIQQLGIVFATASSNSSGGRPDNGSDETP